jgi:hypothetical protein
MVQYATCIIREAYSSKEFAGKNHLSCVVRRVKVALLIMILECSVPGLDRARSGWSKRKRHPLQDLVRECRYRKATNPPRQDILSAWIDG